MKLKHIRKIAVLRANALGDFIFILPAMEALRAAYPTAEIVLLGRNWHAEFLAGLATPDTAPLDRMVPYIYFQPEILRYVEVVGLVGATTTHLEPRLCVTAQDLEEACRVVPEVAGWPAGGGPPSWSHRTAAARRQWVSTGAAI